jgi:hypothetical protein
MSGNGLQVWTIPSCAVKVVLTILMFSINMFGVYKPTAAILLTLSVTRIIKLFVLLTHGWMVLLQSKPVFQRVLHISCSQGLFWFKLYHSGGALIIAHQSIARLKCRFDTELTNECIWTEIPIPGGLNLLTGNHYFFCLTLISKSWNTI